MKKTLVTGAKKYLITFNIYIRYECGLPMKTIQIHLQNEEFTPNVVQIALRKKKCLRGTNANFIVYCPGNIQEIESSALQDDPSPRDLG